MLPALKQAQDKISAYFYSVNPMNPMAQGLTMHTAQRPTVDLRNFKRLTQSVLGSERKG